MEQEITNKRKANVQTLICVFTLAVLLLLLVWRVPFGYDWSDESDYLALPYRLLAFDRPLVDTWEVHQLSALITLPLVALFRAINGGSMDGVLLFTRYCFVAVQFLASVYAFFVLRKRFGNIAALIAAALLLGYTHFSINSLYYNSYALLFLALSALLALDAGTHERHTGWRWILSGLLFALSVQAQPYVLLAVVVWPFLLVPLLRGGKTGRRFFWLWVLGAALVALAFVGYVAARSPLGGIPANIKGMLSDPSYPKISYMEQLLQYLNAIRVIFSPFGYGAAALIPIGIWYLCEKNQARKRALRVIGGCMALVVMIGAVAVASRRDWSDIYRVNTVAMAFSLAGPGLYLLNNRKMGAAGALFFFGCALSIATQFGSNTRILASSGMLVLGSMGAVLCLFSVLRDMAEQETLQQPEHPLGNRRGLLKWLTAGAIAVCLLGTVMLFWFRVVAVHRDNPLPELTQTIQSGPAKGIRTTPEHARNYEQLVGDIRALAPGEGTILVSNLFPDSYMLTNLTPAAPGEFNMSIAFLQSYYAAHPERLPDYIFAIDESYGRDNDQSAAITAAMLQQGEYETYPRESGIGYIKKQD